MMNRLKTPADSLAEEALTDLADTFFGARRQVEDMLEAFRSSVETLRAYDAKITSRAAILHYFLLRGEAAEAFYRAIGVSDASVFLENRTAPPGAMGAIPRALTARGRFVKLVLSAYDRLARMCDTYMNGRNIEYPEGRREEASIHYRQLIAMAEIVNQRIKRINTEMSPSWVLQYARQLSPGAGTTDCIAEMECPGRAIASMDTRLAFQPIDLKALHLHVYPELPPPEKVSDRIVRFCRDLYSEHKEEIRRLLIFP